MNTLADLVTGFVALEHLGFLILEMFLWKTPTGLKTFQMTQEFASSSANLAANQGLYNGFLFAGLAWSLVPSSPANATPVRIFFLSCVALAGIFGAFTVSKRIFFIQALPAAVGIALQLI